MDAINDLDLEGCEIRSKRSTMDSWSTLLSTTIDPIIAGDDRISLCPPSIGQRRRDAGR
jgi:hypothetical protein